MTILNPYGNRMYDSVTASNIPKTARIVAGYVNGIYRWKPSDWALFPNSRHVTITIWPTTDAEVIDVEWGDTTPATIPGWLKKFRPDVSIKQRTVYCSLYTKWPAVYNAVKAAGIPQPAYWIADYIKKPFLIAGSTATQWTDTRTLYDITETDGIWPTIQPGQIIPPPKVTLNKLMEDEMGAVMIVDLNTPNKKRRLVWEKTGSGTDTGHQYLMSTNLDGTEPSIINVTREVGKNNNGEFFLVK